MPYIRIVADTMVTLSDEGGNKHVRPFTFLDFINWITNDTSFGTNAHAIIACHEIMMLFKEACASDKATVKLTKDQYDRIDRVLKQPSQVFHPALFKQLIPYIESMLYPLSDVDAVKLDEAALQPPNT